MTIAAETSHIGGAIRASSWESGWSPKPLDGVRILTLVLMPTWLMQKGVRLVSGIMLVRNQSSALWKMSRWCSGFALDSPKVQALVRFQVGILR
jgi:hypothetical protein